MTKRSAKTPASVQEKITALKRELALLYDDYQVAKIYETFPKEFFCTTSEEWPDGKNYDYGRYDYNKSNRNIGNMAAENWLRAVILHMNTHLLKYPLSIDVVNVKHTKRPPRNIKDKDLTVHDIFDIYYR